MLPSGTVTFLFSDIEGSTQLLQAIGVSRYEDVLQQHRRLLRAAFVRHSGHEFGTEGDAHFVAFARAVDAVRAASDAQRALATHAWAEGERIRVRIGLHTCEATVTGSNYVGIGVHRAARIGAAGHGGQVVLSQTTRDLLADDPDVPCVDLGAHRLKDFGEPQRLYQLAGPDLPREFPPLRTPEERRTNLPARLPPLFGRESELDAIRAMVLRGDARVVTLTGPGGTGKTSLSRQAAADLLGEFADGVYVVMLQALSEPELLLPAIAQTLGVREAAGQSLSAYLAPKEILLVLDNFEQIIGGAPTLADLLGEAPYVKLIVTSREPLHVAGERVFPVPPLALPDLRHGGEHLAIAACASVRLFVARAQSVQPFFALTPQNAPAVAELCVRLDGLPLALELAAARTPLLSPEAMLKRLGERLKLLTGGARDVPQRQRTLRNTLRWSYELLEPDERALFARLAVFAGGFTLEAAEAVCDADIATVASLVDRSMVRRDGDRFGMLETIREFALEQLRASPDADSVRDRHAAFFEALAEETYARRWHDDKAGLDLLEREHDNLRAALDELRSRDAHRALRLAGALGWFWHLHSHFGEGSRRLAEALKASPEPGEARARALAAAGEIAAWSGDLATARPCIEAAVTLWRSRGATQEVACALIDLGWGCFFAGDADARRYMEEGLRPAAIGRRSAARQSCANRAPPGSRESPRARHRRTHGARSARRGAGDTGSPFGALRAPLPGRLPAHSRRLRRGRAALPARARARRGAWGPRGNGDRDSGRRDGGRRLSATPCAPCGSGEPPRRNSKRWPSISRESSSGARCSSATSDTHARSLARKAPPHGTRGAVRPSSRRSCWRSAPISPPDLAPRRTDLASRPALSRGRRPPTGRSSRSGTMRR